MNQPSPKRLIRRCGFDSLSSAAQRTEDNHSYYFISKFMPSYQHRLTPDELSDVLTYLLTLKGL